MSAVAGTVYLVGAGPGDPGLLTVRGRHLLETADCVVTDALVAPAVLRLVRADAEVHHVGKRGGQPSTSQGDIEELLIRLARQGRSVVRLKGGDPFLFGRGGEECEALRAAGIPYEVVGGVTSALAAPAAAGIPVTHREWASHVTIATGHERDDGDEARVDLETLARLLPGGTLVFLMGARSLPRLVAGLLAGGAAPTTPAAAIQWGTDPRQRLCVATLETLVSRVEAEKLGAPMVTVVGRVAALAERLAWFPQRPLAGRRVIVTRARAQASDFAARLVELGADVVEVPVVAVEPVTDPATLAESLEWACRASGRAWVVLTSANGVPFVWAALRHAGGDARRLAGVRIAAIGPATAAALEQRGLVADLVPREYVAEALAEALVDSGVAGGRVLLARADGARDVLPQRLSAAGAEVRVVATYRSVVPPEAAARLRAALAAGPVDAVTFTSSSTVRHFVDALRGAPFPPGALAACIGPVTAAAAQAAGFPVAVVAAEYTTAGLAAALAGHFGTAASG